MRWLVALLFIGAAHADPGDGGVPRGLGHPEEGHSFYSAKCCNMTDCEPVPEDAITPTASGWVVFFRSKRGHLVAGTVPNDSDKIYPTEDARQHVCSSPYSIYCIYVRFGS